MDLRKKKTLRAISNAFLQLRARKPLEKITVTELCQIAEISKATFYLHYQDIFDLSEKLQQETVTNVFQSIAHPEWVLTNAADFTKELFYAFISQRTLTEILFSGPQEPLFPQSIEREIRTYIETLNPEFKNNMKANILLTYQVQGGYNAYCQNKDRFSGEEIFPILSQASTAVSSLI